MKTKYKNFDIEVKREICVSGYYLTYYNIFTKDGFCVADSFTEAEDPIEEIVKDCKKTVDEYIENPKDWDDYSFQ